jgi:septum formation protein
MTNEPQLILASSSPHRARALSVLGIGFATQAPAVTESRAEGETAQQLSLRLGLAKAQSVQDKHPQAIVIGSDQVGLCEDQFLGKPGSVARAQRQLEFLSGKTAEFFTSIAIVGQARAPWTHCTLTSVKFRAYDASVAAAYVSVDEPMDCAGSFKSEGLGIALFEWVRSDDPTALVGLPMIALTSALQHFGINPIARHR